MTDSVQDNPGNDGVAGPLGIVGGGQLGRMLVLAARGLGVDCVVLDPDDDGPALQVGAGHVAGGLFDADALAALTARAAVTTFEIEATDAEVLGRLAAGGHLVRPRPHTLAVIQDKLVQKRFLRDHGLPTSDFIDLPRPDAHAVRAFGLPSVQKLRRGGYDGRGVQVLRDESDLAGLLDGPSLLEAFVETRRELAVVGARGLDGEIRCYEVVDMTLGETTNMLEMLIAPARIDPAVAEEAVSLAHRTLAAFDDVGVFAVELFLSVDGELLVNEVSPRVHNSGHFSIDACETSQFEQHVRAVLGLPLGDTRQHRPAVMLNLLGEPGYHGPPLLEGEAEAHAEGDVFIHLYGKRDCRAARKMGHVTVLGDSVADAVERARRVREVLRIRGARADQP